MVDDSAGGDLGLTGAVSMALGEMTGGGIYAVLGVVVNISGATAWVAFVLAGLVALCVGYSYIKLNQLSHPEGASPTFLERFAVSSTLAGMAGWTLLFGFPLRVVLSLAIVGLSVGLNLETSLFSGGDGESAVSGD
jgi:amino acid transporter